MALLDTVSDLNALAAGGVAALATAGGAVAWVKVKIGRPLQALVTTMEKLAFLVDGQPAIADPLTGRVLQVKKPGIAAQVAQVTEAVVGPTGLSARVDTLAADVEVLQRDVGHLTTAVKAVTP